METRVDSEEVFQKRPKRVRKRHGFTLSKETMELLEKMKQDGEAPSISRAIDLAVAFFCEHSKAIPVQLTQREISALYKASLKMGQTPPDILAHLARSFIETQASETAQK